MAVPVWEIGPHEYTCSPLWVVNPARGMTRKNISSMPVTATPMTTAVAVPTLSQVPAGISRTARAARVTTAASSTRPTIISR